MKIISLLLLITFACWSLQEIPGCQDYDVNDSDSCMTCKNGFYISVASKQTDTGSKKINICNKCNLTCQTCTNTSTHCTSCDSMFKLNTSKNVCQATTTTIIKISLIGLYLLVIIGLAIAFCVGVFWAVNTSTATPYKKIGRQSMRISNLQQPVEM